VPHQAEVQAIQYFDRAAADRLYATPAMALQNAGLVLLQVVTTMRRKYLVRAFESDASSPWQSSTWSSVSEHAPNRSRGISIRAAGQERQSECRDAVARGPIAHAKSDARAQRRLGESWCGVFRVRRRPLLHARLLMNDSVPSDPQAPMQVPNLRRRRGSGRC